MDKVRFENITAGYNLIDPLFSEITLFIEGESFTALTGPNGSGKSTLLKLIYKELKAYDGVVYLNGEDVAKTDQKSLARQIGFVSQHGENGYAFTVREAVAMGRYAHNGNERDKSVIEAMQGCSIDHLADKLITDLSGGELQRVHLARALAQEGKLLLLDEPVNHLDVKHQRSIMRLLLTLRERGYTIVCVLHDLLLAQIYSDRAIMLKDGAIHATGSADEVFTKDNLQEVYQIEVHQVHDPILNRSLWLPSHNLS